MKQFFECVLEDIIQPCRVQLEGPKKEMKKNYAKDAHNLQLHRMCKKQVKGRIRAYWCSFCKKKICSLAHHMKMHHKSITIRCKSRQCASYFLTEDERRQHEKQVHIVGGDEKKCVYCGRYYSSINNMSMHVKNHHIKEAIQCEFIIKPCAKYFLTITEKDEHVLQVHKTVSVIFGSEVKCVYCGKICKSKKYLCRHVSHNHAKSSIKCKFYGCGLYFQNQSMRKEHIQKERHQVKDSLKKLLCPKCSYKSHVKCSLQAHIKTKHAAVSKLQCHKCPKTFKIANYLKYHLKHFHGERFFCEFCGKDMQRVSMKDHLRRGLCKICNLELPCANVSNSHQKICPHPNDK